MFGDVFEFVEDKDAFALRRALRLDNPHVTFGCLLKTPAIVSRLVPDFVLAVLEVFFEVLQLLWKHERLGDKVEVGLRILLLHFYDVYRQPVLLRQFEAQREVVDFLGRYQPFVEIRFALRVSPQHVPIVPICVHQAVELQNEPD